MPFPTISQGRVDVPLTNVLQAYSNPDYLAPLILPAVPVVDESGLIGALENNHLRVYSSKRALYDEGEHRMEFKYTKDDTYQIDFYDREVYLPDRLKNNTRSPFDARRDAGFSVMQALMLERENGLATALHSTAVITQNTTLSGTSQFSDFANSNPDTVIETGRTAIHDATGREANSMVIGRQVFNTLKRHPFFLEMVKGISVLDGAKLIQLMKDFFELENVYVAKGIKVTTNEGQSETKAKVWQNDVVLFYKPARASLYEPSFGYQLVLSGGNLRTDIRRHPLDLGDIVRVFNAYQDKILDTNAGYLIKDAV